MLPSVLAHLLPFAHGAASEPWIVLGLVFVGVAVTVLTGIAVANAGLNRPRIARWAAGLSAGVVLFLFVDLVKEAATLGQGLVNAPLLQLGLLGTFAAGALLLPFLAGEPLKPQRLAWLWAIGIAAHGAGEGWIIGTEASSVQLTSALGMLSFLLHKAIEGATIPVVAAATVRLRDAIGISVALAAVALVAGAAGLFLGTGLAPLILFAAGAGASTYAIALLVRGARVDVRWMLAVVIGVALVYGAGLLHEV